jgi:hypothetical protein
MSEQTWFKLLIRAIGVFLIAMALPELFVIVAQIIQWMRYQTATGGPPTWQWTYGLYAAGSFVKLAIGLYLFTGGAWIFRRCMRDLEGHCFGCGYALHGVTGDACPECGIKFRAVALAVDAPARSTQ